MEAMKSTAIAPSNLAFGVKYMGKVKSPFANMPENDSISFNLSGMHTRTTVHFSPEYGEDTVTINGVQEEDEQSKAINHLDLIRHVAGIQLRARVLSENNFPTARGLSSSASGFAALTVAGVAAAGKQLTEKELTILSRKGSGSSCRSIPDGFVQWHAGDPAVDESSFAESIYPPEYWNLAAVVAIVGEGKKTVSTTKTHAAVKDSPLYAPRIARMPQAIATMKDIIARRDFAALAPFMEFEAQDMHDLFESVGVFHLSENARLLKQLVQQWRNELKLMAGWTVNTGQDVYVVCPEANVPRIVEQLEKLPWVQKTIVNRPAIGTRLTDQHLF